MGTTAEIGDIFNRIRTSGQTRINSLQRKEYYKVLNYKTILEAAIEIGKQRTPSFLIDKYNEFAYTNFAKWLVADPTMQSIDPVTRQIVRGNNAKGIYLAGYTGTGKSLATEIMSYLAKELGLILDTSLFFSVLSWGSYRADSIVGQYAQTGDISKFFTADTKCICIQDIGTESIEATYMGSKIEPIRQVIETRADNSLLVTHFTSNIPLWNSNMLISKYGDRAYDRLIGMCNYLEMTGTSRRR